MEEGPAPALERSKVGQLSPQITIPNKRHWGARKGRWVPKGNSVVWERSLVLVQDSILLLKTEKTF